MRDRGLVIEQGQFDFFFFFLSQSTTACFLQLFGSFSTCYAFFPSCFLSSFMCSVAKLKLTGSEELFCSYGFHFTLIKQYTV